MRSVLQYCLVLAAVPLLCSCDTRESRLQKLSKKLLLDKELQYLRDNPMSEELQEFISRFRRDDGPYPKVKRDEETVVLESEKDSGGGGSGTTTTKRNGDAGTTCITITGTTELKIEGFMKTEAITGGVDTGGDNTAMVKEELNEQKLNPKLLNKVVDDVQELMKMQQESFARGPESSMCNVTGDWDSHAGGMQIRIESANRSYEYPNVTLVDLEPPPLQKGFLSNEWNISGHIPFNHSSVIVLTAVHTNGKQVAVFIGECRVCESQETITGMWMIGRKSKSCKDREESHSSFTDVFVRNNVRELQQLHYRSGGTSSTTSRTTTMTTMTTLQTNTTT